MRALLLIVLITAACGCPQKPGTETGGSQTPPAQTPPAQTPAAQTPPAQTPPAQTPPAQTPPAQTPPAQTPPGSGSTAEPAPNWPKTPPGIGETCGPNDACAKGLACVAYYGIAGPRGGQFKSCEVQCKGDGGCPAGHKCITIADGPGQVCRK
ncbi:MAG TPA: hypothetical protein VIV11_06315 [Kofleriaceae bacterium]